MSNSCVDVISNISIFVSTTHRQTLIWTMVCSALHPCSGRLNEIVQFLIPVQQYGVIDIELNRSDVDSIGTTIAIDSQQFDLDSVEEHQIIQMLNDVHIDIFFLFFIAFFCIFLHI